MFQRKRSFTVRLAGAMWDSCGLAWPEQQEDGGGDKKLAGSSAAQGTNGTGDMSRRPERSACSPALAPGNIRPKTFDSAGV